MSETTFSYDHNIPLPADAPEALPSPTFQQGQTAPSQGRPLFFHQARKRIQTDGASVYENIECVKILTPGDTKAVPELKVTDAIRRKYAYEYGMWKNGLQVSQRGIPLEMFPMLTPAVIMELKALNIFTVEDLAGLPDSSLHRVHMGQTLKVNAKAWLENKKDSDVIERQTRENNALKDKMAMLERQIQEISSRPAPVAAEAPAVQPTVWMPPGDAAPVGSFADALSAAVDQKADEPSRRRGRPPKIA